MSVWATVFARSTVTPCWIPPFSIWPYVFSVLHQGSTLSVCLSLTFLLSQCLKRRHVGVFRHLLEPASVFHHASFRHMLLSYGKQKNRRLIVTYGSEAVWTCHVQKNLYCLSNDVTPDSKAFGFYSVSIIVHVQGDTHGMYRRWPLHAWICSMPHSLVGVCLHCFKGTVLLLTRCFGVRWFVLEIHGSCYEKFHGLTYINLGMGTRCSVLTYSGNSEMKPGTHPCMKKNSSTLNCSHQAIWIILSI